MEHGDLASADQPFTQQHPSQQIKAVFHGANRGHTQALTQYNEDFLEAEEYAQSHAQENDHCQQTQRLSLRKLIVY